MNQPLDFSSGVRSKAPPSPVEPKRPKRRFSPKPRVVAAVVAVVAAAAVGGYLLLGRGGETKGPGGALAGRFCEVAAQLDQVSLTTGAASAHGVYDGPPEKIKVAVGQMGETLNELKTIAPSAVTHDVGVVVEGLKSAALGDTSQLKDPAFAKAAQGMNAHRLVHCGGGGGGSGEG